MASDASFLRLECGCDGTQNCRGAVTSPLLKRVDDIPNGLVNRTPTSGCTSTTAPLQRKNLQIAIDNIAI